MGSGTGTVNHQTNLLYYIAMLTMSSALQKSDHTRVSKDDKYGRNLLTHLVRNTDLWFKLDGILLFSSENFLYKPSCSMPLAALLERLHVDGNEVKDTTATCFAWKTQMHDQPTRSAQAP